MKFSPALFPVAVILAWCAVVLVWRVSLGLVALVRVIARGLEFRRLTRELGSRGAARRYLRAMEWERLHAIPSLASSSVPSISRGAAAAGRGSAQLAGGGRADKSPAFVTTWRRRAG